MRRLLMRESNDHVSFAELVSVFGLMKRDYRRCRCVHLSTTKLSHKEHLVHSPHGVMVDKAQHAAHLEDTNEPCVRPGAGVAGIDTPYENTDRCHKADWDQCGTNHATAEGVAKFFSEVPNEGYRFDAVHRMHSSLVTMLPPRTIGYWCENCNRSCARYNTPASVTKRDTLFVRLCDVPLLNWFI